VGGGGGGVGGAHLMSCDKETLNRRIFRDRERGVSEKKKKIIVEEKKTSLNKKKLGHRIIKTRRTTKVFLYFEKGEKVHAPC